MKTNRLLQAYRKCSVDKTPIWLMRQAGRYMPEYRALRKRNTILELIKDPELAAEITLQPLQKFDLDAAIIFADLLTPLEAIGLTVEFVKGDGPVIHNPIRTQSDIASLTVRPVEESLAFTLKAIRLVSDSLKGRQPVIGFSGAPFTVASYAIEGGASRDFAKVKSLMYNEPLLWHKFMEMLSQMTVTYLNAQIASGAQVVQLFDSWVGSVSPHDFRMYILDYTKFVVNEVKSQNPDIPIVYFGTATTGLLDSFKELQPDAFGIDWRVDIIDAWSMVGDRFAIQGNLDPHVLCGPIDLMEKQVSTILDRIGGRPGFIFNLGHGIYQHTSESHVKALVDFVHQYSGRHSQNLST